MIIHYLKVAFRNLLKYKTQSIISIVGLAVGFTCFALSAHWLQYEMTYDNFHKDADRIYTIYYPQPNSGNRILFFDRALENDFPEVESSCSFTNYKYKYQTEDGVSYPLPALMIDSCFMHVFNIHILAGTKDFLNSDNQVAITTQVASILFNSPEAALGKTISKSGKEQTICALVEGFGKHTNLPFSVLGSSSKLSQDSWNQPGLWIKLKKGADVNALVDKLYKYGMRGVEIGAEIAQPGLMPITKHHYKGQNSRLVVHFRYMVLFCITGALVILCALFNYLSIFVSRLWMRTREMALRKVCGSGNKRLYALLFTEFSLALLGAFLLGMVLIELSLPSFCQFTKVSGEIYVSASFYFAGVFLFALIALGWVLYHFNLRTLQQVLKGEVIRSDRQIFYKGSLVGQLIVSLLFVFCVGVIMKQLYFLRNGDVGLDRKNTATVVVTKNTELITESLKQLPIITEVTGGVESLMPLLLPFEETIADWEGKQTTDAGIDIETFYHGEILMQFYKLRLLMGRSFMPVDVDSDCAIISESAARQLGWSNPVGKTFVLASGSKVAIIGLVKDIYESPTAPAKAKLFFAGSSKSNELKFLIADSPNAEETAEPHSTLIKYHGVECSEMQSAIDSMMIHRFPGIKYFVADAEKSYEGQLKSENLLLKLLSVEAVVCILISIFGIYSFVTLTCERRRKEIAIRKVNGARVGDILLIFLKEYMILLLISSAIAFPFGYVLMKKWIEAYTRQTPISAWMFLVIFAGVALIILLSIASRVWVAARQNPAEVIKSE